jgi:hypothetical protein
MPRGRCGDRAVALGATAFLLVLSSPASSHERQNVDKYQLTIGWGDEPVFSGSRNSVEVDVANAAGAPVSDLGGGSLSAEISFGDERVALPLLPAGSRPGRFRAWLVPTRSGTYSFHITGSVKGQAIDVRSTCSESTFDCVTDASELQFPVKDPSAGQLAESVARVLPRAEKATADAASAHHLAIAALALAAVALAAMIGLRGRKGARDA